MHKHVRSNYQNPSQKFLQKHKNIKSPPPKKKKNLKNLVYLHEIHEEREKGEIKSTYQVKEAWIRMKMKREEGF